MMCFDYSSSIFQKLIVLKLSWMILVQIELFKLPFCEYFLHIIGLFFIFCILSTFLTIHDTAKSQIDTIDLSY